MGNLQTNAQTVLAILLEFASVHHVGSIRSIGSENTLALQQSPDVNPAIWLNLSDCYDNPDEDFPVAKDIFKSLGFAPPDKSFEVDDFLNRVLDMLEHAPEEPTFPRDYDLIDETQSHNANNKKKKPAKENVLPEKEVWHPPTEQDDCGETYRYIVLPQYGIAGFFDHQELQQLQEEFQEAAKKAEMTKLEAARKPLDENRVEHPESF